MVIIVIITVKHTISKYYKDVMPQKIICVIKWKVNKIGGIYLYYIFL